MMTAYETCDIDSFEEEAEDEEEDSQYVPTTTRGRPLYISPRLIYAPTSSTSTTSSSHSKNNMMQNYISSNHMIRSISSSELEVIEERSERRAQEADQDQEEEEDEEMSFFDPTEIVDRAIQRQQRERTSSFPATLTTTERRLDQCVNVANLNHFTYLEEDEEDAKLSTRFETSSTPLNSNRNGPTFIQDRLETIKVSLKDRYYKPLISSPLHKICYVPTNSSFLNEFLAVPGATSLGIDAENEEVGIDMEMESFIDSSDSEDDDEKIEKALYSSKGEKRSGIWSKKEGNAVVEKEEVETEGEKPSVALLVAVQVKQLISIDSSIGSELIEPMEEEGRRTGQSRHSSGSSTSLGRSSTRTHESEVVVSDRQNWMNLSRTLAEEREGEMRDLWCTI